MSVTQIHSAFGQHVVRTRPSVLPNWLVARLSGAPQREVDVDAGMAVTCQSNEHDTLASIVVPDAATLDADAFERCVADVYRAMRSVVASSPHVHPVRFWNVLPGIHAPQGDGRDRYMVFNAGRYEAYREWWGSDPRDGRSIPTASAVGSTGSSLHVTCLAQAAPGVGIENPRQRPAYRYSSRFGPLPPCFARMTLIEDANESPVELLVGGTASVRGEASLYQGDAAAQTRETLDNLVSLIEAASAHAHERGRHLVVPDEPLDAFAELRVFVTSVDAWPQVERELGGRFGSVSRIELVEAALCRDDLIVEIEGLAHLSPGSAAPHHGST